MSSGELASPILLSVGDLLGRETAIDEILERLVHRIREVMDADRGTLYVVDRGKGEVVSRVAQLPEITEIRLQLGQGVAGYVAATGDVVNVPTSRNDARFYDGVDQQTGYRTESILAAPMRDRSGGIIGVIQLLNKRSGPFTKEDELTLSKLVDQAALAIEATTLYADLARPREEARAPLPLEGRFNLIVGESEALREACRRTWKAAATEATVLLRGESGTGKELFARAVHVNSPRRDGPLVKVDCAALPASLIDNELFGHERGSFTGAEAKTAGKLDAAEGGTLFLDELGELPLSVQGKLLRVLQDREFERIGGSRPIKVDVRIVAATNRDLEAMVGAGQFRADLYFRVRVVEIALPALRKRGREDILRLARHFISAHARRLGCPAPRLSAAAASRLAEHPWPGNVRELENCLESALVVMDGDEILPSHLAFPPAPTSATPVVVAPAPSVRPLADVEREHVLHVLDHAGGNRSEAAKLLGIGRNTLMRKLKSWGM